MFIALLLYMFIGYMNQLYSINMTAPFNKEPLYDVGFQYIPKVNPKFPDYALILFVIYFVCRWMLIDRRKISNFMKMMRWVFFVRLCCFGFTTVPYPVDGCNARRPGDPIIWNVLPYLWDNHIHSCYDMMFSGHAAHVTLIWLFTMIYSKSRVEKIIVTLGFLTCCLLIIAGRIHYTYEVIVGSAISILMFGTFFSASQCPIFYPSLEK